MNKKPLVSVTIGSYNHEDYVQEAIFSILKQSFQDFEIIVTDDGSSDKTSTQIEKIKDPRIKLYKFKENQGACIAFNHSIQHAKGKYIAIMNSDDEWLPQKLEKQVNYLEKNEKISAVFSHASLKNEKMEDFPINQRPFFYNIFSQKNKTSAEWLNFFFNVGNALCHPSLLIRRDCYDCLGLYDNRLRQLPDFDMWIRFCKIYDFHILQESLLNFRITGGSNASSPTVTNVIRCRNESHIIMKSFFDNMSINIFKKAFKNDLADPDFTTNEEYECEKMLIYLNHSIPYKLIGIEKLYSLLRDSAISKILQEKYKYDDKKFIELTGQLSLFPDQNTSPEHSLDNALYILKNSSIKKVSRYCFKAFKTSLKAKFRK